MALTFTQWLEEFRPFPTDRVNRQIERLKKKGGAENKAKAKTLEAQKKYQTKMKSDSQSKNYDRAIKLGDGKDTKDYNKQNKNQLKKMNKIADKQHKAVDKGKKKKSHKLADKFEKKKGDYHARTTAMASFNQRSPDDDSKQVKHNMEVKRQRKAAETMMKKTKLNKDYKDSPSLKERMNFTDYINSVVSPLYEKEGEAPKCPPGYRFDKEMMMCVPKTPKDKVGNGEKEGNKDLKPGNGAGYNTWGNSGYDGAGYAWEEPATATNDNSGGY